MSVYKRGGVYWTHFSYRGVHYQESTGQITKEAAEAVERRRKDQIRQEAHGVSVRTPTATPRIQDWAETYYEFVAPRLTRPQAKEHLITAVLRFWGEPPANPERRVDGAPYHDLTLGDVVDDPHWLVKFEAWMTARALSPQTKNHYRSTLHDMFKVATHPQWRTRTGVLLNPFAGQWRDPTIGRRVTITREDLEAILRASSFHLRLAMAIALLAPKLRIGNILQLKWSDLAADFSWITVEKHKTVTRTRRPLVAYVPEQLREILREAKRRADRSPFVITYQGRPVKHIKLAVRGAVQRAKAAGAQHLVYGRAEANGITFHTLRHTAATLLAELEVSPEKRQALMGHSDLATTMQYTHLRPTHEMEPAEQLSAALPIRELVLVARQRPPVADPVTTPQKHGRKRPTKPRTRKQSSETRSKRPA